jgi:ParB-like chromosome segregation protein Spo0J
MSRVQGPAPTRWNSAWELAFDKIEQQPIIRVAVRALSVADSPRRSGENLEHIQVLAAVSDALPPIIVHRGTMRVIDGVHRLRAAKLRKQEFIDVIFFEGSDADAFVVAVRSNVVHGLPLSLADRKSAAGRIIESHPQWSDRMIASVAGLAPRTVGDLRASLASPSDRMIDRIGRDGRVRPIDGSEGRRLAFKIMSDNPSLSLRQVARAAGISPETARDVRSRLNGGDGPVPERHKRDQAGLGTGHERRAELRPNGKVPRRPPQDQTQTIERLKADPALRLTETGRSLLRLLQIHVVKAEEWEKIGDSVPQHCSEAIAELAKECSYRWARLAERVEQRVSNIA